MIFKQGSCADEVFDGMQSAMQAAIEKEDTHQEQLVYAAMQALNDAAQNFEMGGRSIRAAEVTEVMNSLAEYKEKHLQKEAADLNSVKCLDFWDSLIFESVS
jgi:hypothetical protein